MTFNRGPINDGRDYNFFQKVVVLNAGFTSECTVLLAIPSSFIVLSFINEGSATVEYSFNGNTTHGDLVPDTPSEALSFEGRNVSKIWFKVPGGGSSTVRVEAFGR